MHVPSCTKTIIVYMSRILYLLCTCVYKKITFDLVCVLMYFFVIPPPPLPLSPSSIIHPTSPDHYRSYSRHSYDAAGGNLSLDHERSSHGPSSNAYKSSSSSKGDFRSSRYSHSSSSASSYHPKNYRPSHHHHSSSNSHSSSYHNDSGDHTYDEEVPLKKRPRLTVDISRKAPSQLDAPNSADSVISSSNFTTGSATPSNSANESPAASPPSVCMCVCVSVSVSVCCRMVFL